MSEPRLITPLLANHIMGDPISDHCGVRCCPAMLKDTDHKFIVKIVSVPASTRQLEALLYSGAYQSRDDALRYFQSVANEVIDEAQLLKKLSRLEGFRCYDSWQLVPMEDGTGYDVYLLSPYELTLEQHTRRNCLTHLAAVNLGLDLCAALSVARRNGFLYVDLKPENIFISSSKGYLIGDLGFVALRSLAYASLPEKYRSAYTAPEIADAYASLNDTIDIYALGLILYQIYNGGLLPSEGEATLPPAYADYEMAEIILKACAPSAQERWQDPQQMGQALAGYLQRNTVNDTPIIPLPIPVQESPADVDDVNEVPSEESEALVTEEDHHTEDDVASVAELPSSEESSEDTPAELSKVSTTEEDLPADAPSVPIEVVSDETISSDENTLPVEEDHSCEVSIGEDVVQIPSNTDEDAVLVEDSIASSSTEENEPEQFIIEGFFDETLPDDENTEDLPDSLISEEVSRMLAQADELIAHKAPDPVIPPEPIEVPTPPPILPNPEPDTQESEATEPIAEEEITPEDGQVSPSENPPAPVSRRDRHHRPKRNIKWGCLIGVLLTVLISLLLWLGGNYYYNHYYVQHIDSITVDGAENYLTVYLDTDIDNSLLTVVCTDTYGNRLPQPVVNNCATFTSLSSGTHYQITVQIEGFHKLTGKTTAQYNTAAQTSIVNFTAITGETDGSVILSFSVMGPDSSSWLVKYAYEGGIEQTAECSGHMAIIAGLELNQEYTFRLVPRDDLYVVSGDTLQFESRVVVYPQELTIHGFQNGCLSASWKEPDNAQVNYWTVRCYNNSGYDSTITVTEPSVSIEGLDISQSYTLDVKADGMTVSKTATISANSITFQQILMDPSTPDTLILTWTYEGIAPTDGWHLRYSVDNGDAVVVVCEKNTYTIEGLVPGSRYDFSFILPSDITVIGGSAQYSVPAITTTFSGYEITAEDLHLTMMRLPLAEDWTAEDGTFDLLSGDQAALLILPDIPVGQSDETLRIRLIFRNQNGNYITMTTQNLVWSEMWFDGYFLMPLHDLPTIPGTYTLEVIFDDAYITSEPITFTVSAATQSPNTPIEDPADN